LAGGGRVFSTAASEFGTAFLVVSAGFGAAPSVALADADAASGIVAGGGVVSGAGLGAGGGGSGFVLATGIVVDA